MAPESGHEPARSPAPGLKPRSRRLLLAVALPLFGVLALVGAAPYLAANAEIAGLPTRSLAPCVPILALVCAVFVLFLFLLHRALHRPPSELVRWLDRVAQDPLLPPPRLPAPWQGCGQRLAGVFAMRGSEDALRSGEEQYRAIFNATSDALTLWSAEGRVVDTNLTHQRLSGFTLEEIKSIPMIELIHPSSHAGFKQFEQRLARGEPFETEAKVFCKDGRVLDVEVRSVPMLYQGKQHALVITRDITELKRAEEELARQRDALLHSEKLSAMGALLAGVAHELNNPLAILMGRAALLEDKTADESLKADVRKIHDAAERCGRIVRTFLAMARRSPGEKTPTALNDVVTAALDLLGYGLRSAGIKVETDLAPDLPLGEMDADQIGQVAVNLIVNAQQALEDAQPTRLVRVHTFPSEGALCLRVADNGPGVPPELAERIFDPFFTTKSEGAGTGVGLSVCRAILREHGGSLTLEAVGSGASFLARIPVTPPSTSQAAPTDVFRQEARAGWALVVDDEAEVAGLLGDILESAGFSTVRFGNGREALAWIETHPCDLVLSDIRMPDMDGPALWRALEERRPELARRMAFITGDTLSAGVAAFLQETGLPGLEKPFTPEEVLSVVARIEAA